MKSDSPTPEELAIENESVAALGPPTDVFKPGMENVIAGFIFVALLIAIGVGCLAWQVSILIEYDFRLPWKAERGASWLSVCVFLVAGVVGIGCGIGLIFFVRRLASTRVYSCPAGIYQVCRGRVTVFPWLRIESVTETILQEHLPLKGGVKYLAPAGKSRSYVVRRNDGVEMKLDGNSIRRLVKFAQLLQDEAAKRDIRWDVVEQST
jgi:hypothetical protein